MQVCLSIFIVFTVIDTFWLPIDGGVRHKIHVGLCMVQRHVGGHFIKIEASASYGQRELCLKMCEKLLRTTTTL